MLDSLVQTITAAILSAGGTGAIIYFVVKHSMKPIDAYLETKGKNLATHEDIQKLVDQVRATKMVEADISDNVWDRQQRWTAKHAMYREVMEAMNSVAHAVIAYNTNSKDMSDYYTNLLVSVRRFQIVSAVAAISVSDETNMLLRKLAKVDPNDAAGMFYEGLADIVIAARKDLGYPPISLLKGLRT
jgi:hypothetical protein